MEAGTKVRVRKGAKHHAGREGYFAFYGKGSSKGVAVCTTKPSPKCAGRYSSDTFFAVGTDEVYAVNVGA